MTDILQDESWRFWVDRGGTFTDIVAQAPDGSLITHKLLSENPAHYEDSVLHGIHSVLGIPADQAIPANLIAEIKVGTTVGTNALLERTGERTLLVMTSGFGDALKIGYQNRPKLFDLNIRLPEVLYECVLEVDGRVDARGNEVTQLDEVGARDGLLLAYDSGIRSCAIALMHGYRYTEHEERVATIARAIGFTQVSTSNKTSPLMKLVSRGHTTVVDAYLSPVIRRYVERLSSRLKGTRIMFMRSSGGLIDWQKFRGRDCILSGPAGGVVGAVRIAERAGYHKIIGFDMGGTSTDVSHYCGTLERTTETEVGGVMMRAPMLEVHTIAAGGGSVLHFDTERFRVGPDSAGAHPGPVCYRRGGPLTVTDCQVMLGRLQPRFFPSIFGPGGDEPLDRELTADKFAALLEQLEDSGGVAKTACAIAEDFLDIAVQNMARAIKKISVERGHDVTDYTLVCFGGAGGQHACMVADALGMRRVLIHPLAGVLSAYGIGVADLISVRECTVEQDLDESLIAQLDETFAALVAEAHADIEGQNTAMEIEVQRRVNLRYAGSDTPLSVAWGALEAMCSAFAAVHERQFGFVDLRKTLIVESLSVEVVGCSSDDDASADQSAQVPPQQPQPAVEPEPVDTVNVHFGWEQQVPVYQREHLLAQQCIAGPALVVESTSTTVVMPGWLAEITEQGDIVMRCRERVTARDHKGLESYATADPTLLEIFNSLFMSVAEQMGVALQNTASSVNIKERLDFSCALFDRSGALVANAPHIPVHLGSMSESVARIIETRSGQMAAGDVYMLNDPYHGGTHLPDITVITPVFDEKGTTLRFFVASRGHHADIGGTTPGSVPPWSTSVEEEGVLIDNVQLVKNNEFLEDDVLALLASARYPARNPLVNIADLKAQVAANAKGVSELERLIEHFGIDKVEAYMAHVHNNADRSVQQLLRELPCGEWRCAMDDGAVIAVEVRVDRDRGRACVDFTGTSQQLKTNLNAPKSVSVAAILYVLRCLVNKDIPLNAGCLNAVDIVLPEGSMLNPRYPAAVVGGNVETSQYIVDALLGALGVMAGSQGTSNNFTFGNDEYQYYETLCGGAGAGQGFAGAGAVHTHMTNTRLTDPEVLEWRFPVLLERFGIRLGSGGDGRWRGGDGVVRHLRFLQPMTAGILSGRRLVAPFGMDGGEPGRCGRNAVVRSDGRVEELGGCCEVPMNAGDVFVIETPGGGGFGRV